MCQRETEREDWYLLNQILGGGNPLWSTSKFTASSFIWSSVTCAVSLALPAFVWFVCVCGCVFWTRVGWKRGWPADNGLHSALPPSPSVCLVLAFRFFFNLSLLLCAVEVRLAQAGVVVSRGAVMCMCVYEWVLEREREGESEIEWVYWLERQG